MSIFSGILGTVFGQVAKPVVDIIGRRQEIKAQRDAVALENEKALREAEISAVREGRSLDNLWELESLKNSGWKDEMWSILFAIPAFAVFIPGLAPYIKQGFEILDSSTPEWYRWMLMIIVGSAFGVRIWRRL